MTILSFERADFRIQEREHLHDLGSAAEKFIPDSGTGRPSDVVRLWNACPWSDRPSPYDKAHLDLFTLLLEAEAEGATHLEMAWDFFEIDPSRYPGRAIRTVRSHLERARWLAQRFIVTVW